MRPDNVVDKADLLNLGSPTKRPMSSWAAAPHRGTARRHRPTRKESPRPPPRQARSLREDGPPRRRREKVHGRAPTGAVFEKGGRPAATAPRGKDRARPRPTHPRESVVASTRHVRPGRPDAWIPFSGTSCPNMHCSNCCSATATATATARALREELTDTLHSTAPRVRKTAAPPPRTVRERLPPAVGPSAGGRRTHRRSPPRVALARSPGCGPVGWGGGVSPLSTFSISEPSSWTLCG